MYQRILCLLLLFGISGTTFAQNKKNVNIMKVSTEGQDKYDYVVPGKISWKEKVPASNFLGIEAYANSGNLYKSGNTKLWTANSFIWETYYAISMPKYNWISLGTGFEIGASIGRNNYSVVYDRAGNESFYFIMQAYLNITPWFTLHFNSTSRIQWRSRYTAMFSNPVNGNFGHFLLSEFGFGFYLAGNEINAQSNSIDKFWIDTPYLEFLYYIQVHKNVGIRWYSKFMVNNQLFYDSGITTKEAIPMEHYFRLDFILGNGVTIWIRAQWNIYNSDFNAWAFYPEKNPFDIQLRAGAIFFLDFRKDSTKNI